MFLFLCTVLVKKCHPCMYDRYRREREKKLVNGTSSLTLYNMHRHLASHAASTDENLQSIDRFTNKFKFHAILTKVDSDNRSRRKKRP